MTNTTLNFGDMAAKLGGRALGVVADSSVLRVGLIISVILTVASVLIVAIRYTYASWRANRRGSPAGPSPDSSSSSSSASSVDEKGEEASAPPPEESTRRRRSTRKRH